ncbi:cell division protein ZapE [Isoptericola sp. CG 20/1183]|uniref:Cell division protein ZapE n=1 Tax=Isoptericola halotolerans TaxID=300560 RepID=A0ABX5EF64_9MICO|nr:MULTISPECIES: cell division protein ZapE [Isoptericola]PRZ05755.1 cell division protein ZapE [Isoptericola halotolerans]PRZ06323.1 cell division protein ZapE [Isoptericola sp. CG 20/1183]
MHPILDAAADAGMTLSPAQRTAAGHLEGLLEPLRRGDTAGGVYLWGPVGRGKTWLLDRFHAAAGGPRFHFHEFYRALHAEVWARTGRKDAMARAVDALLGDARTLCFDELHLHDSGDTMLLTRALRTLRARGVTVVATSNYPPHGLLPSPLFHHLAEPLIELIEGSLTVVEVAGTTDFRTLVTDGDRAVPGWRSGRVVPAGTLEAPDPGDAVEVPLPGGRTVPALRAEGDTVWFDFLGLCAAPVSALDLLFLAERYQRFVLLDLVPFARCRPETQARFVSLVDVLYDRDQALVLTLPGSSASRRPGRLLAALLTVPAGRPAPPDLGRAVSRLRQVPGPPSESSMFSISETGLVDRLSGG